MTASATNFFRGNARVGRNGSPVIKEGGAHAGSERDADHAAGPSRRAGDPLADGEGRRVVDEDDASRRHGQCRPERRADIDTVERVELADTVKPANARRVVERAGHGRTPDRAGVRGDL